MTREQKILSLLAQFDELGISKQIDYDKFCLYSIVANSAALDGSTPTDVEVQLLLDEGISADSRPMAEQLMVLDLNAAMNKLSLTLKTCCYFGEMLNKLSSSVLRNTANVAHTKRVISWRSCVKVNQKQGNHP